MQEQAYQTPDLERLRQSFVLDRHLLWWPEESSSAQEPQANTQTKALKKEWEEIAQMMDVDLDTLSKEKQKSEYEYIEHVWLDFAQIKQLILDGRIREDRSIAILFKYMMKADGRAKGEAQAGGVRQAEEE